MSAANRPIIDLQTEQGASVQVHLNGAHVTSWRPTGDEERLFLSAASEFGEGKAIRGGVPVIFPQFSDFGPLQRHGFARKLLWTIKTVERDRIVLTLSDFAHTLSMWPHAFVCEYEVHVSDDALALQLTVLNSGNVDLEFTAALHTYLQVNDIATTQVAGLRGTRYMDNNHRELTHLEQAPSIRFTGELDRVYYDAPKELALSDGRRTLQIESDGFPDAVVWNPGPDKAAALMDLANAEYRSFVCVEAAIVSRAQPIKLVAGARWSGMQRLCVMD